MNNFIYTEILNIVKQIDTNDYQGQVK